jgi:glycosyltransferase involved in cell wall biosynthesis
MTAPLHLLSIEPTYPGKLGPFVDWLARGRGWRVWHLSQRVEGLVPILPNRGIVPYQVGGVAQEAAVPWTQNLERGLHHAFAIHETLLALKPRPIDLVLARSAGLGSSLFVPVWDARVPIVNYFDYFVQPQYGDVYDELAPTAPPAYHQWRRAASAMDLLDLDNRVVPWTGSAWQRTTFPAAYHRDFTVQHLGIDPVTSGPKPYLLAGRPLDPTVPVVAFVARSTDLLRGYERFYVLAAELQAARPDVVCIAVGNPQVQHAVDTTHYHLDYPALVQQRITLPDPRRFWHLGLQPAEEVRAVLRRADVFIYASRPYPVADVLLEALSVGCACVVADTPPVREVLDERSAVLVPSAEGSAWTQPTLALLADPARRATLAAAGQRVAARYARQQTWPALANWLATLVEERTRSPVERG